MFKFNNNNNNNNNENKSEFEKAATKYSFYFGCAATFFAAAGVVSKSIRGLKGSKDSEQNKKCYQNHKYDERDFRNKAIRR